MLNLNVIWKLISSVKILWWPAHYHSKYRRCFLTAEYKRCNLKCLTHVCKYARKDIWQRESALNALEVGKILRTLGMSMTVTCMKIQNL